MKLNQSHKVKTFEGANACVVNAKEKLKRTVMVCMLWENSFYEDGVTIAERIETLVPLVKQQDLEDIVIEARENMNLRHAPLLICSIMAKHNLLRCDILARVIQRADELTEFLAIYWRNGKCPISAQVKKGLAKSFCKFDEYALAKYNRDNAIKLKDVLFLCHAKPLDDNQAQLWKRLIKNELAIPETWEVELSKVGANKKEVWTRLLLENKLGALALLRNLRNFHNEDVDTKIVKQALENINVSRVLPFRFIAAAKYAPTLEENLEKAMFKNLDTNSKIKGKTVILVDISGSMDNLISQKSDMNRLDAACGLAMICRELCEDIKIFSFSTDIKEIPTRRGFALKDAIISSQHHGGTELGRAINIIKKKVKNIDRIIVITDEQSTDNVSGFNNAKGYIINVANYENGVGYGQYTHINGWSESVVRYIQELEK